MNRKAIYWLCNAGGWFLYGFLNALLKVNPGFSAEKFWEWFSIFFFGLFFSHLYRYIIVRLDWLRMNLSKVLIRLSLMIILLSLIMALITMATQVFLVGLHTNRPLEISPVDYASTVLAYLLVFVLWTLVYFAFHYFVNYKKTEIENLKWQAAITEAELNRLKSQLNPHFVFNAMNSIRALVDEEPAKAKEAVTQLANILRNTLMMGRSRLVPFGEELKVVRDYLALESIRLEERLKISLDISPESNGFELPPLMLQTLVENAIKHGIAKLRDGGNLEIRSDVSNDQLHIRIRNSGHYSGTNGSETGVGIKNTLERLKLLYGHKANFRIQNEQNDIVLTELTIPKL